MVLSRLKCMASLRNGASPTLILVGCRPDLTSMCGRGEASIAGPEWLPFVGRVRNRFHCPNRSCQATARKERLAVLA